MDEFYSEATSIRSGNGLLPSKTGQLNSNIGIADVNIDVLPNQTLRSVANDSLAPKGFVTQSENSTFQTKNVGGYSRAGDTEAKILTNIDQQLKSNTNANGTVNLFTERPACASCLGVIDQFQTKYPNIQVNLIEGDGKYYKYNQ